MIWINFGKWSSKSTGMFIWRRVYQNGFHWTPFVIAERRYKLEKLRGNENANFQG